MIGFTYDANGNVTSVTPPGRPAHSFQFTSVDLLNTYTPPSVPGGGATTYTYNRDHQMTLMTRPDSQTIALAYDTAGRIQSLTAQGLSTTYGYDSFGRLGAMATSSGSSLTFAYDGPLLTQQQWSGPVSGAVSYSYDSDLRIASENGVSYGYDTDGLLTSAGSGWVTGVGFVSPQIGVSYNYSYQAGSTGGAW